MGYQTGKDASLVVHEVDETLVDVMRMAAYLLDVEFVVVDVEDDVEVVVVGGGEALAGAIGLGGRSRTGRTAHAIFHPGEQLKTGAPTNLFIK